MSNLLSAPTKLASLTLALMMTIGLHGLLLKGVDQMNAEPQGTVVATQTSVTLPTVVITHARS